jgi:hypothetical protein
MGLGFSGVHIAMFMPPQNRKYKQADVSYLQPNSRKPRGADSFDRGIFASRFWDGRSCISAATEEALPRRRGRFDY